MRKMMAGFVVFGLATIGAATGVSARPLSVLPAGQPVAVQRTDWDGDRCDSRCEEHRHEARERDHEREGSEQRQRWREHQRSEESRYPDRR